MVKLNPDTLVISKIDSISGFDLILVIEIIVEIAI